MGFSTCVRGFRVLSCLPKIASDMWAIERVCVCEIDRVKPPLWNAPSRPTLETINKVGGWRWGALWKEGVDFISPPHTHTLYCPHIRCNLGQAREDSETPDARRESHVLPNLFPDAFFPASSQLSASGIILISSSCSPHRDTYASSSSLLLPPTLWNNRSRGGGGRSRLFCPRFVGRLPPLRRIRADTPD